MLCTLIADRIERKWPVCLGAVGIGVFGMLFANSELPAMLILLGVLVILCNNLLSYSYQSELFPTRIRSRVIGFVYSWSRLSAALSGLVVAFLLHLGGVNAVFGFIAFAMAIVVITIGGFGPPPAASRSKQSRIRHPAVYVFIPLMRRPTNRAT